MKILMTIIYILTGMSLVLSQSMTGPINLADMFLPTSELEKKIKKLAKVHDRSELEYLYYGLAVNYAKENNSPKAIKTVDKIISDKTFVNAARKLVDVINDSETKKLEKVIAVRLKDSKDKKGNKVDFYQICEVYGRILTRNGKHDDALKYTELAYLNTKEDEVLKRNYHYLLSINGRHEEAVTHLADLVKKGFADDLLKTQLEISYKTLNPIADFDVYFKELQNDLNKSVEDILIKQQVHIAAKDFSVYDTAGKLVSLNDFRGKTVVIDFWATWCGPCVAALPAMQKVVDLYKNDNTVNFFFINTHETAGEDKKAIEFFRNHAYSMDLYIDRKDPKTGEYPAFESFGVKGIPHKIVIDPSGYIKFKSVGFMGGTDHLVEELSQMIELSK